MAQAIGIDIGTHAVKIAVLQKKGAVTRATRLYRATLAGDEDRVRLQGALARAGIAGGPGLLGITGRDLIIRYTHVPPVPDWRLKLLMQFEINEVSGQSGDEVAADYRRLDLPVEADEETVLVALARNSWLHPRLEAARGSGLKAAGGCPNSVALLNAFLAHGQWKEGETTYLVNVGRENIDMAIQRDGELLFARNMSGGGHMFTESIMSTFGLKEPKAEKNKVTKGDLTPKAQARYADSTGEKLANAMLGPAGQLVSMIQSSVMICRAQTKISDLNVDRLLLAGGAARMKGIVEYFRANMSVPVDRFDPVDDLDLGSLPAADQEELGEHPTDFAVAVGLAQTLLQPASFRLEVLTEKEKKKRHFTERAIFAFAAAAAALALVVMLFKTRGGDIEAVEAANARLETTKQRKGRVLNRQKLAESTENDARKKDVAMRSRRLAGGLGRAVQKLLIDTHPPHHKHLFLEDFRVDTDSKVSLDLNGRPGKSRAALGDEESGKNQLHAQSVWPVVKVRGKVQPEYTPEGGPGRALNLYYVQVTRAVEALRVEGWAVDFKKTSLDSRNAFEMTFALRVEEPKKES